MKKKRNISFLLIVTIAVLMILLSSFLMNHLRNMLRSDMRISLDEIVTQNKNVIASKLAVEVNNLYTVAKQISELLPTDSLQNDTHVKNTFRKYAAQTTDQALFLADKSGNIYAEDPAETNIKGRTYFRLAMQGKTNISDCLVSRKNGEDIFVISTPIIIQNTVLGSVQKMYTQHQMYEICKLSLFSDQGNMYIINPDGYILIDSQYDGPDIERDNFLRMLYRSDPNLSRQLQSDIRNNRAGFFETTVEGVNIFSVYTPIEEVYDWYLISSVPISVVSKNTNRVLTIFYSILLMTACSLVLITVYILLTKKRRQMELEKIAFQDTITGKMNLNQFTVKLSEILAEPHKNTYFLMAVDVDSFKYINSHYGFDFGNNLLYEINKTIEKTLLPDEMIARMYSDHFILLLKDVRHERLKEIIESVHDILNIKVYISVGIYEILDEHENINLMADKATMAAESVRHMHYNRIGYYSEKIDTQMKESEQLKRDIELAIANKEFVPFFQPKVDIETRKLIGAEALARWPAKNGQMIAPNQFIPLCEKTGQVVFLDMIILEKTLQFLRINLDRGVICVPISVNFSQMHLQEDDFIDKILNKLQEYNVPPHLLELELTETVMFEKQEKIIKVIDYAHEHGLAVSMDDFGSGYSSLNMLKDIPLDTLKIDSGFLNETAYSDRQRTIFSAVSSMAKALGMEIVVEGVESADNVEMMRTAGCRIAQGYYYSKPLDRSVFEKIYQDGTL